MIREDQIILNITREFLLNSSFTQRTFAETKLYPLLQEDGCVLSRSPRTADDYTKQMANMQNQFTRVMTENSVLPLSWKWPWIHALPEPYQSRCIQELTVLIPSVTPSAHGAHAMTDVGRLGVESGEAIAALAKIAADGAYDAHDDVNDVKAALDEVYDLRDHAQATITEVEKRTGIRVVRSENPRVVVSIIEIDKNTTIGKTETTES